MRVLFPYEYFGPYHRARLRCLIPEFQRTGFQAIPVQLFDRADTYNWSSAADNAAIHQLHLQSDGKDQVRWRDCFRLQKELSNFKPHIVFINGWGTRTALSIHAWCKIHNIVRVLVSDSQEQDFARNFSKERVKSWLVKDCEAAFVAGTPQRRYLEKLGVSPRSIFDGCDVVDNNHFAAKGRQRSLGGHRLLTVARLEPEKNLIPAAKAFLEFLNTRPNSERWQWSIVGYGSQEFGLKRLADQSQGRIKLLGYKPFKELPAIYAEADLYWQPSIREPWGLVINEAMAAGLPVLASRYCGCTEDLISSDVGWVFDSGNKASILAALELAADCREYWAKMGRAAASKIISWDLDRYVKSVLAAVQAVCRSR